MTIHATGKQLIDNVINAQLADNELGFWWLAQHSFILKIAGLVLYIDPFLSAMDARLVPPLFTPEQCLNADIIFGSHDHADHIDRPIWPTLSQASPNAKFIVPELLRDSLIEDLSIDAPRFIGMDDGQSIEYNGVRITALASAHEFLDQVKKTGRYPYLGFVIEACGLTVYHSGDTCLYDGLIAKLRQWEKFDLMMLPINGRDADKLRRNIVGNMTYQEAVDLAGTLGTRYVVPTHYDMYEGNLANAEGFRDYLNIKYPHVQAIIPNYGQMQVLKTTSPVVRS